MTAETSNSYSRDLITNKENRDKAVQEMRAEKGHVTADKVKTPEQKKELSEKWLKKAGLTDAGGKAEIMKLLGDPKTAAEFVAAVEKKQEEYGLKKDGILGWATLEKMDAETDQHEDDNEFDSYTGLSRAEAKAAKVAAEEAEVGDKKQQLAELQSSIDQGTVYVGEVKTDPNGRQITLQETADGKKQWVVSEEGAMKGRTLNTQTGEYENATNALTTEQIKKHGEGFAIDLRQSKEGATGLKDVHGDPVKVIEQDDSMVALGTGKNEGKIYNPETGTYEEHKAAEKQNLATIKNKLKEAKGFDDGQKIAKGINADLSEKDLAEINQTLLEKGWKVENKGAGTEYYDYNLIDVKSEQETTRLAKVENEDPLFRLGQKYGKERGDVDFGYDKTFSESKISELEEGIEDNFDVSEGTLDLRNTINSAIVAAKKEPLYSNLTLGQYVELKKNPEGFLLDTAQAPSIRGSKRAEIVNKASGNGTQYTQEGKMWTKQEKGKTYVGVQGKFVDFEDYARTSLGTTFSPTKVPGNPDKYYMVTFSPTGEKQITIGKRNKEGGIEQKGARYYSSNGGWKDSNVG